MTQHRAGAGSAFCLRYGINPLGLVEAHPDLITAIALEKALKGLLG